MKIFCVIYYSVLLAAVLFFHQLLHGWGLIITLTIASIPLAAINETAYDIMSNLIDLLIEIEWWEMISGAINSASSDDN